MTIILIALSLAFLLFFLVSPRRALILLTLIYLESFFKLINANLVLMLTLTRGASINLGDALVVLFFVYTLLNMTRGVLSPGLMKILIFLFVAVLGVTLISIVALGASPGIIANRLRSYAYYALIPGLALLVRDREGLRYLVNCIFVIGIAACLFHFVEIYRGAPFVVPNGEVNDTMFLNGVGQWYGFKRLWNRANSCTMLMFIMSVATLASKRPDKSKFMIPLVLSSLSIILALTRTIYAMAMLSTVVVMASATFRRQGSSGSLVLALAAVAALGLGAASFSGGQVSTATMNRLSSLGEAAGGDLQRTTMSERIQQFNYIKDKLASAPIPPVFGLGFTTQSVQMVTADLGYVNIIVNLGIAGVITVYLLFRYLFTRSLAAMRLEDDMWLSTLGVAIFALVPVMVLTAINFDYFTGRHFVMLALTMVQLEVIGRIVRTSPAAARPN